MDTDAKNPKVKTSSLWVNIALPLFHFVPKVPILGEEVLIIHANINDNPITALNVRKSLKFLHATGNLGQGT